MALPADRNADSIKACLLDSLDGLLESDPDFVVSCVNKASIDDVAEMLAQKGIPVLSETPVSRGDHSGRIQVAEQYHFLPEFQARKAIADSGILGEISQVQLSCCHDYHAVSLMRWFLDVGLKTPVISSVTLPDRMMRYNGRNGKYEPEETVTQETLAVLDYGGKSAVYDFEGEQYFSDIRGPRIVIRGTSGEIINNTCTYLMGNTAMKFDLIRNQAGIGGNLDGMYLESITGNGKVLYRNPFPGIRFSDEETAIATCLLKMKEYTETGREFYTAEEAALDHTTGLCLH